MWELYEILLSGIDDLEKVEDFLIGPRWSAVLSSSGSVGLAPVILEKYDRFDFSYQPEKGMTLKEFASHAGSWNFMEASLAIAAVNAFYNSPGRLAGPDESGKEKRILPGGRRARHSFRTFCEEITAEGKTVLAEPVYDNDEVAEVPGRMDVLRRDTEFRDYYLSSYRELIPEADRLVLSGKTLVDKTAGPMLERALESGAQVYLFGPDVPLCPALKGLGVAGIWGFTVDKADQLMQMARANMQRDLFLRQGHFVVME